MKLPSCFAFTMLWLLIPSSVSAQQGTARKVYEIVNPSVVAISNVAGSGTGIVLDSSGLILTNAHVVATPMPYKCVVDVVRGDKLVRVTFKRVRLISRHPKKDLALIRINPKEHEGDLIPATMSKTKPVVGQQVYAIGNPAAGSKVLDKSITAGLISGRNREIDGIKYYQVDASINPGNSGGPICNNLGEVVGVATLKASEVEGVGFALPVDEIDEEIKEFERFGKIAGDDEMAKEKIAQAREVTRRALRFEPEDEDRKRYFEAAASLYNEAITYNPNNYEIYFNCGLLYTQIEELDDANAYLLQAIKMKPHSHRNDFVYRQLGICLKNRKMPDEAGATWHEGALKHPTSGYCWELYARHANKQKNYYESAYAATMVIHVQPPRVNLGSVRSLRDESLEHLKGEQLELLREIMKSPAAEIEKLVMRRKEHKKQGIDFMLPEFAEYVESASAESKKPEEEKVVGTWKGRAKQIDSVKSNSVNSDQKVFDLWSRASDEATSTQKANPDSYRTWVDRSGKFRIEARFVELSDEQVSLEVLDGDTISVPLSKLSEFDQAVVKQIK